MSFESDSRGLIANQLTVALSSLERVLVTPLVPGEFVAWISSVQDATLLVGPLLTVRLQQEHAQILVEILQQDAELSQRVEHMRDGSVAIQSGFGKFEQKVSKLGEIANEVGSREDKFDSYMQQLIQDGIELVVMIRKQEAAIDTWHRESLLRDRGGSG